MPSPSGGRFSSLLLEGLDEYRRGNMHAAVRAWEEAYTLEPTNPRAREFLHSALERIYAQMGTPKTLPPLGEGAKTNTILLPHSPSGVGDLMSQIRDGILIGDAVTGPGPRSSRENRSTPAPPSLQPGTDS